jgi:hypothetical protein
MIAVTLYWQQPYLGQDYYVKNFDAARYWCRVWIQLLYSNNRNRLRWVVSGVSQDGACTVFYENLRGNSLRCPSVRIFHNKGTYLGLGLGKKSNFFHLAPDFGRFLVFTTCWVCAKQEKNVSTPKLKFCGGCLWVHMYTYNVFFLNF